MGQISNLDTQFYVGLITGMAFGGGAVLGGSNTNAGNFVVTFKNGDAILQTTDHVPFGSSVTYTGQTPTKNGYIFTGWNPSPINIISDTTCYAQFSEE